MLPTYEHPIKFIIPGVVPALKNRRAAYVTKNGGIATRPNFDVERSVLSIKAAFNRQLESLGLPRPLITEPHQAAVFMVVGVHSVSNIPNQDLDNAVTTLQEAMQGSVLPGPEHKGDRLVYGLVCVRRPFAERRLVHSVVYVWASDRPSVDRFIKEAGEFLRYLEHVRFKSFT